MAISLGNRAKMTTSTTGTGTITLGSAVSGYQSFDAAGITNSQTVRYAIEDGTAFEIGSGTYTSSGTTLTRSVTESSNSDSAITLTGNAEVFITATVADLYINDGASTLTTTGVITGGTVEATSDTAAGDNAAMGFTSAEGLILTGQGSTNDVTIKNDADADVLEIPTGTTNVTVAGNLGVGGTVTATGTSVFATLDISGDVDVDGTLESDAITLNGTAVTATATLDTGISNNNVPKFTSGVADNDFLRVDGTAIEGRSASEVLSDIAAAPAAGSSNIVTTGALNSGSITSGFGTIDTGSSNITTTGVGSFGSLDISGDIDVDGTTNLDVVDIDGAVDMASTALVTGVLTANGGAVFNENSSDVDFRVESNGNANMLFVDGGNDAVVIGHNDATNGTFASSQAFQVVGTSFTTSSVGLTRFSADANGPSISLSKSRAAGIGTDTVVQDNDALGNILFTGADGTDLATQGASISAAIDGTPGGNDMPTRLTFATTGDGNSSPTERFRISSDGSLSTPTSGTSNVRFGVNAGNSIASGGDKNVFVGDEAGTANTTGTRNVAVGFEALKTEDGHGRNVAVGYHALEDLNAGTNALNIGIGYNAGANLTTGIRNTLIGANAGDDLTDADDNVAIGRQALSSDTLGSKSVAIGNDTLFAQNFTTATDSYNTAVGYAAGTAVTTGVDNTLIGGGAGDALTDADNNVAVGRSALGSDTLGSKSTAVGRGALGAQNFTTATDSNNTAVGYTAGNSVTTGTHNSFLGAAAGLNVTTGLRNTLIGALAGDALTDADSNVAVGANALGADTLGSKSIAIGQGALFNQNFTTATDSHNVAIGHESGLSVTTGVGNTFVGSLAGDGTDDGNNNTAVGYLALSANCGNDNTAVGLFALGVCTGTNNTGLGKDAAAALTSGSNNLFLGKDSGRTGSPGGNVTTQSNGIYLGDESIGACHIQVDWTVASDQRDKTDFTALDLGLDFVKALAPVTYKWDKRSKYGDKSADDYDLNAQTPDGTYKEDWLDIGFKAQEVQALEEAAGYTTAAKKNLTVSTSDDGKQMGLQYSKFVPILVKAIQEQNALIEALTARVATLEG